MGSTDIHATFTDKLSGKKVIWKKQGYEEVRKDHPEVDTHFKYVKEAIEDPTFIRKDKDYNNRRNSYLCYCGGADYKNHHMKVVVCEDFFGKLRVITAYFTDYLNPLEDVIWSKLK